MLPTAARYSSNRRTHTTEQAPRDTHYVERVVVSDRVDSGDITRRSAWYCTAILRTYVYTRACVYIAHRFFRINHYLLITASVCPRFLAEVFVTLTHATWLHGSSTIASAIAFNQPSLYRWNAKYHNHCAVFYLAIKIAYVRAGSRGKCIKFCPRATKNGIRWILIFHTKYIHMTTAWTRGTYRCFFFWRASCSSREMGHCSYYVEALFHRNFIFLRIRT